MRYLVCLVLLFGAAGAVDAAELEAIAHRGYVCNGTDNTLQAVRNAWSVSADAVEVDVRVASDGVAYLFHDEELDGARVDQMTYAEVQDATPFHVPTLAELLAEQLPVFGDEYFLLDLKSADTAQLQIVAEVIRRARIPLTRVALQSDSALALRDIRRRLPDARLVYLSRLKREFPFFLAPKARKIVGEAAYARADAVSLKGRRFITRDFVRELHQAGLVVNFWTINGRESQQFYRDIGVDGLITDAPVQLKRLIGDEIQVTGSCATSVAAQ